MFIARVIGSTVPSSPVRVSLGAPAPGGGTTQKPGGSGVSPYQAVAFIAGGKAHLIGSRISVRLKVSRTTRVSLSAYVKVGRSTQHLQIGGGEVTFKSGTGLLLLRVPRRTLGRLRSDLRAHRALSLWLTITVRSGKHVLSVSHLHVSLV